jgi:hypothetical protein
MNRPIIEETKRPFGLWHPQRKHKGNSVVGGYLPYYRYKYHANAKDSGWRQAKHLAIGDSIEVIDVRNGDCIGTYTRRYHPKLGHYVSFMPRQEKKHVQD